MLPKFLIFASLLSASIASPLFQNLVLHDQRSAVPRGFVKGSPAPAEQTLTLRIALKQSDRDGLEKTLFAVSTPGSAQEGKFLTQAEVETFTRPSQETVSIVNEWLSANGLQATPVTKAGDWISIDVPVSKANQLFGADFAEFTHSESGEKSVRTLAYSLPAELKGHIDLVHPTTAFAAPFAEKPLFTQPMSAAAKAQLSGSLSSTNHTKRALPAACASFVGPSCLQALYGIPTALATQSSNVLGVSGFIGQFANQADLSSFLEQLRPDLDPDTTFTLQTLDNGQNPQNLRQAGIEADLDIQYTVGVASGVPTTFISVGTRNNDGLSGFLDIILALQDEDNPPTVLTTSYGSDEDGIGSALANRLCDAHMNLGVKGVSILFASGDGGVSGSRTTNACTQLVPTFPSGCPFLTSVGATFFDDEGNETGTDFSSGGFSNVFAQPSFQSDAVAAYLAVLPQLLTAAGATSRSTVQGKFNTAGRAFPDISALGDDVAVVNAGDNVLVGGTSCSSPIFASVIALLNDQLIARGQPQLGFLNPRLYSTLAPALNDVTTGTNPGCNTVGFPATTGWDPITGLGTPNFAALRTAVGL